MTLSLNEEQEQANHRVLAAVPSALHALLRDLPSDHGMCVARVLDGWTGACDLEQPRHGRGAGRVARWSTPFGLLPTLLWRRLHKTSAAWDAEAFSASGGDARVVNRDGEVTASAAVRSPGC